MATQTKVIGPISAYAIAVQEGYTGSKAEWAEAIGNAQENAQIAQEAADRAQSLTESLPQDFTDTVANFAPTYSTSAPYAVGDYVIHNGLLYICKTAIASGEAWTSGHWTQVNVGGELENKAAEISDLKSAIVGMADGDGRTYDGWVQGTASANSTTHKIGVSSSTIRARLIAVNDPTVYKIVANTGYKFGGHKCTYNNGDYYSTGEIANGFATEVVVGDYSDEYYLVLIAAKENNGTITADEARENIIFFDKLNNRINALSATVSTYTNDINDLKAGVATLNDAILKTVVTPISIQDGKCYYKPNDSVINTSNGVVKKYNIESGTTYYVTSKFLAASTGFPLISYFNANDEFISSEYDNTANVETSITNQQLTIPSTATWFYVNARNFDSETFVYKVPDGTLDEAITQLKTAKQNSVSILFIGNSLTQDGIAYLPYLLKNYYPEISFKFYIWYNGGYTLAQHYEKFVNNIGCEIFSISEGTAAWTNTSSTMYNILTKYKIDIVCMQEYFNYKESYTTEDLADWNNCRDYITSNYSGGNGLEFVSLFHAPLRASADNVFAMTKTGNALILKDTISEDMIPTGIAVYRALSTDLDSLGDRGHLSPDGTHTQEGLPCLLQTYVALLWLFDKLGISKSVYGLPFKMTTAIYNTINVPGPNLGSGVIEGTTAQNLLAQEVAIKAYKEGKKFVADNLSEF